MIGKRDKIHSAEKSRQDRADPNRYFHALVALLELSQTIPDFFATPVQSGEGGGATDLPPTRPVNNDW